MRDTLIGEETHEILAQFDRLITEILNGEMRRAALLPWEMDLLVDISTCDVSLAELREYRIAVRHELRHGARSPMKLSDYLARRRGRDAAP